MSGSSSWQLAFHAVPPAIGALWCLALLFVLLRRPSWPLFHFFCFYLLSVFHLAGSFITTAILKGTGDFSVQHYWRIGLVIGRLRYVPLVLFVHSAHRFRATRALTVLMTSVAGLSIVTPFFVYSLIPNLVDIIVVLYAFGYWLVVYLLRNRLSLPPHRRGLLRAVLVCSGFFLTGILLDLLEGIPQVSISVSILLVDFTPLFLVCIGGVMVFWAVRDLIRPYAPRQAGTARTIDFSGLPVTKREREIIGLIIRGETNPTIADRLFISESTVKKHINNLFRKLQITSRWELLKLTDGLHPEE